MKKIMLHTIKPERMNGPNSVIARIEASRINEKYSLLRLVQSTLPAGSIKRAYQAIREMVLQIRMYNPDLVHVTGLQLAGFCATLAAKIAGTKCIVVGIHGFSGDDLSIRPIERFTYNFLIEPLTILLSDYCYTVCKHSETKALIKFIARSKHLGTIYNSIPPDNINCPKSFREELGIDSKDIVIAVVGRLVYDKGHRFIIDAWKENDFPGTKLVIIGEGPYKDIYERELKSLIRSRKVILAGQREDVVCALKEVDIFLFATLHENLSMALLEALSAGCCVVATNVGGNSEVIENNVNGILIEPECSASIFKTIDYLLRNEILRKEISNRARLIDRRFSFEEFEMNMEMLYNKCFSERCL